MPGSTTTANPVASATATGSGQGRCDRSAWSPPIPAIPAASRPASEGNVMRRPGALSILPAGHSWQEARWCFTTIDPTRTKRRQRPLVKRATPVRTAVCAPGRSRVSRCAARLVTGNFWRWRADARLLRCGGNRSLSLPERSGRKTRFCKYSTKTGVKEEASLPLLTRIV